MPAARPLGPLQALVIARLRRTQQSHLRRCRPAWNRAIQASTLGAIDEHRLPSERPGSVRTLSTPRSRISDDPSSHRQISISVNGFSQAIAISRITGRFLADLHHLRAAMHGSRRNAMTLRPIRSSGAVKSRGGIAASGQETAGVRHAPATERRFVSTRLPDNSHVAPHNKTSDPSVTANRQIRPPNGTGHNRPVSRSPPGSPAVPAPAGPRPRGAPRAGRL